MTAREFWISFYEKVVKQKKDIERELYEAQSNKDETHIATVSEKYKKLVKLYIQIF